MEKVAIIFEEYNGSQMRVEVSPGTSLMEAAVQNGFPGIEGECGGACACATCHVYIAPEWKPLTGDASDMEAEMLELAEEVSDQSRLGCQIVVTSEMDGMTVRTPESQR